MYSRGFLFARPYFFLLPFDISIRLFFFHVRVFFVVFFISARIIIVVRVFLFRIPLPDRMIAFFFPLRASWIFFYSPSDFNKALQVVAPRIDANPSTKNLPVYGPMRGFPSYS